MGSTVSPFAARSQVSCFAARSSVSCFEARSPVSRFVARSVDDGVCFECTFSSHAKRRFDGE